MNRENCQQLRRWFEERTVNYIVSQKKRNRSTSKHSKSIKVSLKNHSRRKEKDGVNVSK